MCYFFILISYILDSILKLRSNLIFLTLAILPVKSEERNQGLCFALFVVTCQQTAEVFQFAFDNRNILLLSASCIYRPYFYSSGLKYIF